MCIIVKQNHHTNSLHTCTLYRHRRHNRIPVVLPPPSPRSSRLAVQSNESLAWVKPVEHAVSRSASPHGRMYQQAKRTSHSFIHDRSHPTASSRCLISLRPDSPRQPRTVVALKGRCSVELSPFMRLPWSSTLVPGCPVRIDPGSTSSARSVARSLPP
jgi:hypothetical protein